MTPEPVQWDVALNRVMHWVKINPLYDVNDAAETLAVMFDVTITESRKAIDGLSKTDE